MSKVHIERKPRIKCPVCGFRVRGPKHAEGSHHKSGRVQEGSVR